MQNPANSLENGFKLTTVSARSLYRAQKLMAPNLPPVRPYPAIAAVRPDRLEEGLDVA